MKQTKPQFPQTVTVTIPVGGIRVETTINFSQHEPAGPNNPYVMSVVRWEGESVPPPLLDQVQPTVTVDWEDVELVSRGVHRG